MKTTMLAVALLICLLCAGFTFRQGRGQWEYKVEFYGTVSEKKLNELADRGWELTAVAPPGGEREPGALIFRRPK